jgi:hypothetical protein
LKKTSLILHRHEIRTFLHVVCQDSNLIKGGIPSLAGPHQLHRRCPATAERCSGLGQNYGAEDWDTWIQSHARTREIELKDREQGKAQRMFQIEDYDEDEEEVEVARGLRKITEIPEIILCRPTVPGTRRRRRAASKAHVQIGK